MVPMDPSMAPMDPSMAPIAPIEYPMVSMAPMDPSMTPMELAVLLHELHEVLTLVWSKIPIVAKVGMQCSCADVYIR